MSIYKELSYKNDIDKVNGIQFCILSPEEIIKRSVCEVTTTELFNQNEPAPNGLFDTRMGVLDHNHLCKTCEQKNTFCTGHFGHIVLAKPVFYPHFFDYIRKILHCVCFRCSKLMVHSGSQEIQAIQNKKISRQKKFDLIYKMCSTVTRCGSKTTDGCGAKKPDKIAKDKDSIFRICMEWKNLQGSENVTNQINKQILNAEDVLRILRRISDDDIETLGFCVKYNRPEWMVCTVFPVPPPSVRPSVRNDTGQRSEDDMTHKLSSIVKINQALKAKLEKNASKDQYDMWTQVLQYDVATLIDNNIPGLPPSHQRTGRPIKSISERLKGKEGRIRGNLMGKRVDFSARSVITPDPNISIEELGVPIKVAMNLTFPEIVNSITIDDLKKLVISGPDVYPGAKYIIKSNEGNRKIRLRNVNRESIAASLELGDVVERHLRDGDYVLFNRQPSLHKMSMMSHKIKVMPYNTFRLNVCVTPSFNADFDGDEMNAHVPQSLQTQQELITLASVPQQIMSPRDSSPIVSIVQDIATGVYRMTKSNIRINEKQLFNITSSIIEGIKPMYLPEFGLNTPLERWSGRQMLSMIIPPNINIRTANKFFDERKEDDSENYVVIENGQIKQGTLDKSIYQGRSKGLVHSIYNEYSPEDTRRFFDNTQQMICNWLVYSGFSTGISDLVVSSETVDKCDDIIKNMKVKVTEFISKIHRGDLDNKSTKNNADFFEQEVNNLLNRAAKQVGDMAASQVDDNMNRMISMIKAGAKGSEINFAQMIGCLGQQNVDGSRIPYGFDDRTLPHFTKYDDGAESRGFVQNSFIGGLTPQEFFFHAMGGREGLIDTAVKSVTGDTNIVIIEDGIPKYVRIGDWVDNHLKSSSHSVEHFPQEMNLEMLKLSPNTVYIPTMNERGVVTWGEVTDVTRHDPGYRLYRITTEGGRSVIVTEGKSLLTWDVEKMQFREVLTPEVQVGDYVPSTASLVEPPTVIKHVNLGNQTFDFTYDNGIFLGVFLSKGDIINMNQLVINNIKPVVQLFITGWFDARNIKWIRHNDISLITESNDFFTSFGDWVAECVPTEAFFASDEFVIGILNGYLSCMNTDIYNNVGVSSYSNRIIEGLSMLLTRIGVYCKINNDMNALTIDGRWITVLLEKVLLLDIDVVQTLNKYNTSCTTCLCNDVVLDRIINIEIIGIESYPKMYDLTIPSTLNFGLANGLQVRDTSSTGYVQRQLVKAMEDCKVHHDFTVRNASGSIIQFLYGEDGMDAVKIESQGVPYISMSLEDISKEYLIRDKSLLESVVKKDILDSIDDKEFSAACEKHYDDIVNDRVFMIEELNHGGNSSHISYPVNISRMLIGVSNMYNKYEAGNALMDLSPMYVLEQIDKLCTDLYVTKAAGVSRYFQMLVRVHLSPKNILVKYKLCRAAFDFIVQQITERFYSSIAHPGDMVGVVAAQSVGEPTTQLTLNSVEYNTDILLRVNNTLVKMKIGEYIDNIITLSDEKNIEHHPNDTVLCNLACDANVDILSCDKNGKVIWSKVEAVTRHPVVNEDGSNTILKVTLKSGRIVTATKAKSFLKRFNNEIIQMNGSDLSVGDYIPISNILPMDSCIEHELYIDDYIYEGKIGKNYSVIQYDEHFGIFVGMYLASGCIRHNNIVFTNIDTASKEHIEKFCDAYGIKYYYCNHLVSNKLVMYVACDVLSQLMYTIVREDNVFDLLNAPEIFLRNLVEGYFSVEDNYIWAYSENLSIHEDIQQILVRLGIMSVIKHSTSSITSTLTIPDYDYELVVPEIVLSDGSILIDVPYSEVDNMLSIGKLCNDDLEILRRIKDEDILYDKIVSIDEVVSEKPYVYDLTVEGTRNFNTYSGICMADTFHSAGISSASKAVRGVPRLQELLNVTKKIKTPIMTIHVNPTYRIESKNKEEYKSKCMSVLNRLSTTRFRDIVSRCCIYFDPNDFDTRIEEDIPFLNMYKSFNQFSSDSSNKQCTSPWLMRLEFDRQKIVNIGVDMIDIQTVLYNFYDNRVSCMFSDDNSSNMIMRIRLNAESANDNGDDMLSEIKALQYNIMNNVMIKGIAGIEKISMRDQKSQHFGYDRDTKMFNQVNEWIMDTDGSNLKEILNNEHVNPYLTTTNNVYEIYEVLGIEAARKAIYIEIVEVLSGINVNYRHISLLIDTMTNKGAIMPINRHGINRGDAGPLAKCSFEEVTDMLVTAGVFAEYDKINGVSANVMLGQIPSSGTGDGDVIVDEDILNMILNKSGMANVDDAEDDDDDVCAVDNFKINIHIPESTKTKTNESQIEISFI